MEKNVTTEVSKAQKSQKEIEKMLKEVNDIYEFLSDSVSGNDESKKKLRQINDYLDQAKKKLEQAEKLLVLLIQSTETEERKTEDAILLTNGIREEQEKETEA